jgi:hypothetical protein
MEHGEIDNVDDSLICLVQSLAKPAFPATHFFRLPADRLPCPHHTKSSQAPNSGAGEFPVKRASSDAEGTWKLLGYDWQVDLDVRPG